MKIYVVGIGPGSYENMSLKADKVLREVDCIVGYTVYVDLIKEIYPDKKYITTAMTKEVDRCTMAYEEALKGNTVAVVCSGDAGVYGMAGLMYELAPKYPEVSLEIVSGVTAALSGAAVLGAPLTHDFSVISLSDLMTPLDVIEERIRCAAKSDMCIAIYNPSSKKRHDYLKKACDIMLEYKSGNTVCGYVQNIDRLGETYKVMTLAELRDEAVDMFTTVFIGNRDTKIIDNHMVTPRGYKVENN